MPPYKPQIHWHTIMFWADMKTKLFISFVIPVYNVRSYLTECLESIISQPFDNWEIILVDDKSNDGSEQLCDNYAAEDMRITVLHMPINKGPGNARNEGLMHATGDYVYFLDSDDTIADGELGKLCRHIENCGFPDMIHVGCAVSFGFARGELQDSSSNVPPERPYTADEFISGYLNAKPDATGVAFQAWQFALSRHFLMSFNLAFCDLRFGEDCYFILTCLRVARSVCDFHMTFYHWRRRLSRSLSFEISNYWWQLIHVVQQIFALPGECRVSDIYRSWIQVNANSYITQLESIIGGIPEDTFDSHIELFQGIEDRLPELQKHITENGLLWHIQRFGWRSGAESFRKQAIAAAIGLLHGKADRDIYVIPATCGNSRMIDVLVANGYTLKGLLDNDPKKQGLLLHGIAIFKPEIVSLCYAEHGKIFVIISTATKRTGLVLADQLRGYGLEEGNHFTFAPFGAEQERPGRDWQ